MYDASRGPSATAVGTTPETAIGVTAILAIVATGIYGTIAAAVFILAAMLLVVMRPVAAIGDLKRFWPLLVLPMIAILSTYWSDAPERTLRAGLQLLLTCIATILICRRIAADTAILSLFLGYAMICALALPDVPSSFAAGTPLIGPFESKNQMGFAAHLLLALGLAVSAGRRQPWPARIAGHAAVPVGGFLLILSNSAGAVTSAAITLVIFPALLLFGLLPQRGRFWLSVLLLTGMVLGALLLPEIEGAIAEFRQTVLKKDATLTGRTELWDYAAQLSSERPWLGGGYNAFWRQGNLEAEGIWRWGGIESRTGFNFHNAFVEIQVDLGRVGLVNLLMLCAGIALIGAYRQFKRPSSAMAFFLGFLAVSYSRAYTESNLIAPFNAVTMFCLATAVYAVAPDAARLRRPNRRKSRVIDVERGGVSADDAPGDGHVPEPARA